MQKSDIKAYVILGALALLPLLAMVAIKPKPPAIIQYSSFTTQPLSVLGSIPDFALVDSDGKEVTAQALEGKVWVADFFFTSCAGTCKTMTENMLQLQSNYKGARDVRMVSVSVNPEYDSPKVLAEYAAKNGADTAAWHFLTGPAAKIQKLAKEGFKIGSVEEPLFHSEYFVLVDKKRQIRGYYLGTKKEEAAKLIADIGVLRKE